MTIWRWLIAFLAWLSADPRAIDREAPRAAAAVAAARASMLVDGPAPAPTPVTECDCGRTCIRGRWKPDGRIEQDCRCPCDRCKAERAKSSQVPCVSGTCQAR